MNLKNQKGAITLFVLVSLMFFMASIVSVQMYLQSKQTAVNREYRQIKSGYESNLTNMDSIYSKLVEMNNLDISISADNAVISDSIKKITVPIVFNNTNLDIKSIKYGWLYSSTQLQSEEYTGEDIENWTYVQIQDGNNTIMASNQYDDNGYYYLCLKVNNKEFWIDNPIEILPLA